MPRSDPESRSSVLARYAEPLISGSAPTAQSERIAVLTTLYQEYNKRFLADNNRIWTTGATLVPLSLGAFGVLASINRPNLSQVIGFAVIGWLLMTIWLFIAENHRHFQNRSQEWLDEIEHAWGLPPSPMRGAESFLVRRGQIRRMRFVLWGTVTVAAVVVVCVWPGGLFNR